MHKRMPMLVTACKRMKHVVKNNSKTLWYTMGPHQEGPSTLDRRTVWHTCKFREYVLAHTTPKRILGPGYYTPGKTLGDAMPYHTTTQEVILGIHRVANRGSYQDRQGNGQINRQNQKAEIHYIYKGRGAPGLPLHFGSPNLLVVCVQILIRMYFLVGLGPI